MCTPLLLPAYIPFSLTPFFFVLYLQLCLVWPWKILAICEICKWWLKGCFCSMCFITWRAFKKKKRVFNEPIKKHSHTTLHFPYGHGDRSKVDIPLTVTCPSMWQFCAFDSSSPPGGAASSSAPLSVYQSISNNAVNAEYKQKQMRVSSSGKWTSLTLGTKWKQGRR